MTEIEAQPIGRDERALLRHMLAKAVPQRLMQQVGDRVIGAQPGAAVAIDAQFDRLAKLQRAVPHRAEVKMQLAGLLLRVAHRKLATGRRKNRAGIAELATGFAVERRLVDDDADLVPDSGFSDTLRFVGTWPTQDRQDDALGDFGLVTEEFGGPKLLAQSKPIRLGRFLPGADPAAPRFLALPRHRRVETLGRHLAAAAAQHVLGQIERKPIGVVEPEGNFARQRLVGTQPRGLLIEQAQPAFEGLPEIALFEPQRLGDQRLGAQQFGIGRAHLLHQRRHEPPHQRFLAPEHLGMPHRAAHDAPQHIAAPVLARQHAIRDQEGGGTQMI